MSLYYDVFSLSKNIRSHDHKSKFPTSRPPKKLDRPLPFVEDSNEREAKEDYMRESIHPSGILIRNIDYVPVPSSSCSRIAELCTAHTPPKRPHSYTQQHAHSTRCRPVRRAHILLSRPSYVKKPDAHAREEKHTRNRFSLCVAYFSPLGVSPVKNPAN